MAQHAAEYKANAPVRDRIKRHLEHRLDLEYAATTDGKQAFKLGAHTQMNVRKPLAERPNLIALELVSPGHQQLLEVLWVEVAFVLQDTMAEVHRLKLRPR